MKLLLSDTPQSLYWMGFLIADGYFNIFAKRIELTLSKKDEDHFLAFKTYCKCSYSSERTINNVIHNNKVITNTSTLRTYTKGVKEDFEAIIEKYKISQHKSITPPDAQRFNSLSDDLFCCFVIGLIDGDGWKETGGNKGASYHVIACHKNYEAYLTHITERLNMILNIKSRPAHIKPSKQQAIVSFSPKKSSHLKSIIIKYNLTHLKRKWTDIKSTEETTRKSI